MNEKNKTRRAAVLTGAFLLILCAASLWSVLSPRRPSSGCIADIYQDGKLIASIPLNDISEPHTFTVTGENGGENRVEVRPGSIGIVSADCPDKLCVRQGFVSSLGLPIVCLPNRLVIELRAADRDDIDITTY
ncbi:MAG: NusG domain II-containing protein [bacterium]|nr:NusG domain II-containing protein [bacterium]